MLACCGLMAAGACVLSDKGSGDGGEQGSEGDSQESEDGCGPETGTGGWTGPEVPDCTWEWDAVELENSVAMESTERRLDMTVEAWSDSHFALASPQGLLSVAWPQAEGHSIVTAANGETVAVYLSECASADWQAYVSVRDVAGDLLWEGGGAGEGSCQPEEASLGYADVPTGETCRHGDGRVVVPTAVEVASDGEPTVVPSGDARVVTLFDQPFLVHVLAAQDQLTDVDECSGWPTYTSSVYLARLE